MGNIKVMKLKTAIEYILEHPATYDYEYVLINIMDYANFLNQPLKPWMFIPWDMENNKPLEKPYDYQNYLLSNEKFGMLKIVYSNDWFKLCEEYQQACERVLFEGFELKGDWLYAKSIAINYDGKSFRHGNQTIKTIDDLSGKVDLVEKVAEQFKY